MANHRFFFYRRIEPEEVQPFDKLRANGEGRVRLASAEIEALSSALARLPGLGPRSARRAVLHLVKKRETALPALLDALLAVQDTLEECRICGNVDTRDPCGICADPRRDGKSICVVEDVADLCPRMAVLIDGRISLQGAPKDLIEKARGTVWAKTVERSELDDMREQYEVISTRLYAGQTIVHVLSDGAPGTGFRTVDGGLEDVYFSALAKARRERDSAEMAA